MEDPAEPALVDELLGQGDGGDAAVVVPDRVRHAGLLDRLDHRRGLLEGPRQGLLAEDHLARLGRGDGDRGVRVVGRADVDRVDVLAVDQLMPVGLEGLVLPLVGERLRPLGGPAADGLEDGAVFQVEEVVDPLVGVRVRPAHEAVADQADIQGFLGHRGATYPQSDGTQDWGSGSIANRGILPYSAQPWASRTATIAARMSFQVWGFIMTALGNMQPSQQM